MRTIVDFDDASVKQARKVAGLRTKKETIESALQMLIKVKSQSAIRKYRGKLVWEGDLESMRCN